jgi:hypothetical protein
MTNIMSCRPNHIGNFVESEGGFPYSVFLWGNMSIPCLLAGLCSTAATGGNTNPGFAGMRPLAPSGETCPNFAPCSHAHGLDDDRTGFVVAGIFAPIGEMFLNFALFGHADGLDDDSACFAATCPLILRFNASLAFLLVS